jgi:hypothetical protein
MSSELSSYQQGQLTEKEDQRNLLMIGGIEIFLPHSPREAKTCVADTTTTKRQPTVNFVKKEGEKKLMFIPSEEGKENSEEWHHSFSQEAETKKIATTLKLTTEEEHADEVLTPWEMELDMLEDWLNNLEMMNDCHEQTVTAEEHSEESLKNFIQGDEQVLKTAVPRYATTDEEEYYPKKQLETCQQQKW